MSGADMGDRRRFHVLAERAVPRVQLVDGSHQVKATAQGRVAVDKTFVVSAQSAAVDVRLERVKSAGSAKPPGQGAGSGSAAPQKDATIDPFKD